MLRLTIAISLAGVVGFVASTAVQGQARDADKAVQGQATETTWQGTQLKRIWLYLRERFQNVLPGHTLVATTGKQTVTYIPSFLGAPTRRIGGGTRAPGVPNASLVVFASEATGLTIHAQPSLYWFLSKKTDRPIEFTLTDPRAIQPVIRTILGGSHVADVHELSLAEHGVELKPGVQYEWAVSLVNDPRRRSRDVVSSGTISRIVLAANMNNLIERLPETARAGFCARNGLWYDAIAAVSKAIARHPDDRSLREERASLLRQVGLSDYVDLIEQM